MIALLLAFVLTQTPGGACWRSLGVQPPGAPAALRELQTLVRGGTGCPASAVAWVEKGASPRNLLLVWEADRQTLWRLVVDKQDARWEGWTGATRARLLADDPADGITLGSAKAGKGRSGLATSTGVFVKGHAGSTFDAALPEDCLTRPPAAGAPDFLKGCSG